ncbi:thiamine pyrophosphate-requiring protein, partial [Sphingosinicella sp. CPCC 101087]|uniref:thiamine pyrophosphate-requiring protein n=1 Tax=Sphingosinicella sp. CPCC 101087 TaxID=2497754 RepID=UPI00101CB3B2
MKSAEAIVEVLKREGVETLFAYPRNAVIEAAAAAGIRTIIVRQERTGLHMADALSRMTRGEQMGVFAMQYGPGAENAVGGVAQAYAESVPVLVLPGGFPTRSAHVPGNFNSTAVMGHVAKHAEPLTAASEIPSVFRRAFTALRNGRPRPVVVELPSDVTHGPAFEGPLDYEPVVRSRFAPDGESIGKAAEALVTAKRPVIYAGQGIHWSAAYDELKELAELLAAPVCTSLPGKSAFDETHPLALGSGGAAMPRTVRHFLDEADVILGAGCSLTETAFGVAMPKGKTVIHATLDPSDINKYVPVRHALIGDAKLTLRALIEACSARLGGAARDPSDIAAEIRSVESEWLARWLPKLTSDASPLSPYRVLWDLQKTVDVADTIITHDAGSPRDQLSPFWKTIAPHSYIGWGKST